MKIFLLPKIATQSPRKAPSTGSHHCGDVMDAVLVRLLVRKNACGASASCNFDRRGKSFLRLVRVVV